MTGFYCRTSQTLIPIYDARETHANFSPVIFEFGNILNCRDKIDVLTLQNNAFAIRWSLMAASFAMRTSIRRSSEFGVRRKAARRSAAGLKITNRNSK
jgi:hypothetical protein